MHSSKFNISLSDWLYIIIIGAFFGFLISLFLYFLNEELKHFSTIFFSILIAVLIVVFSFFFISISNNYILPKVNDKFWYAISFIFSFLSGFLGFTLSYAIFYLGEFNIINFIKPYWMNISIIIGFLTFLIGLILYEFISMKYKNELITTKILESKIRALENELNPHFLFNALNSISELIYIDQKKAEKTIIELSKFLRNAISTDSLIQLDNEVKMVETYLKIENIRFDNKIKFKTNINKEFNQLKIPKFSIQLLVENAIKHGFNSKILNIKVEVNKDKIKVINDGILKDEISYGTGLSNLKKRLLLLDIGDLAYKKEDNYMIFMISLKGGK